MTDSIENPPSRLVRFFRRPGCLLSLIFGPWLIVLLGLTILSWDGLLPRQEDPKQLPPLPAPAVNFVGFDTSYFGTSDPYVRTHDGRTYLLLWPDTAGWKEQLPAVALDSGSPCDSRSQRALETMGEPIEDCRTVFTMGEWCPGPVVTYAITEGGDVWQFVRYLSCIFPADLLFCYSTPWLLGLSVVLVVFRAVVLGRNRSDAAS